MGLFGETHVEPFLTLEREDTVVIATLNRPEQRNAISTQTDIEEIEQFCANVAKDPSIHAVILTGAGKAFCAGGNVKDMAAREGMFAGSPYALRNNYRQGIQRIPTALYELEVPVIAAVNGPAIGAGLDLACMCDIRICSDRATFAESFVKLGIVPGDGGAWLLPRVIGMARATVMTLTGDPIDAETALSFGLTSAVVAHDELLTEARALARRVADNPGHALRLAKRLLREGQNTTLNSLLELSAAYQALAHHTFDHEEAVAAFSDRRTPKFLDR
jgi:enoyl-CoA hydratase/carnithine racemase